MATPFDPPVAPDRDIAQRRVARAMRVAVLIVTAALGGGASAAVVGGGGSAKSDCLVVFQAPANLPARTPRYVRCADGSACDADGVINGRCEFPVAVCANGTSDDRCGLRGVDTVRVSHALDNGDALFDPEMQALATRIATGFDVPEMRPDFCSTPTNVHVPVVGPLQGGRCRKGTKVVRLFALSTPVDGRIQVDADQLKLICDPAPAGCDPLAFFTSTYDRIQTQIFDQSCAVGGCHDSQTVQAELLLERGASYDNLVGRTPTNADAANLGWQRIMRLDATHGDSAASYLVHKLTGDLDSGLGRRMPFARPKLDPVLVDVVRRWVEAGAPADGWVPGTDEP